MCDVNHSVNCAIERFGLEEGLRHFSIHGGDGRTYNERKEEADREQEHIKNTLKNKSENESTKIATAKAEADQEVKTSKENFSIDKINDNGFLEAWKEDVGDAIHDLKEAKEELAKAVNEVKYAEDARKNAVNYVDKYLAVCFTRSPVAENTWGCNQIRDRKIKNRETDTQNALDAAKAAKEAAENKYQEAQEKLKDTFRHVADDWQDTASSSSSKQSSHDATVTKQATHTETAEETKFNSHTEYAQIADESLFRSKADRLGTNIPEGMFGFNLQEFMNEREAQKAFSYDTSEVESAGDSWFGWIADAFAW